MLKPLVVCGAFALIVGLLLLIHGLIRHLVEQREWRMHTICITNAKADAVLPTRQTRRPELALHQPLQEFVVAADPLALEQDDKFIPSSPADHVRAPQGIPHALGGDARDV